MYIFIHKGFGLRRVVSAHVLQRPEWTSLHRPRAIAASVSSLWCAFCLLQLVLWQDWPTCYHLSSGLVFALVAFFYVPGN